MGFFTGIFGNAFASEALPGRVDREDAFVDITLPIASHTWKKDGTLTLTARGIINGETVGFSVELEPQWKEQKEKDLPIIIYWGNGHIRSVGEESDRFLSLLCHEYAIPYASGMNPRTDISMVSFGIDPHELNNTPAKIKIFFESGDSEDYGEAFINIDLNNKIIEFRDKDPEYHHGIIASLSNTP